MKIHHVENVNVKKVAFAAIIINALQILAAVALILFVLLDGNAQTLKGSLGIVILAALALIVIWGAVVDIKESVKAERVAFKMGGLSETVDQMNDLNLALRAQRHDFLNHLQVVYSLMEMQEYDEASDYIEHVYGDMQSVSRALRTKCAPVNALLRAKINEGEALNITMETDITAAWEALPLPAWEMCRVLSNLIDNAFDALKNTQNPRVKITLKEDLRTFSFAVRNNGPMVPKSISKHIFEAGVSTKGEGRGMGLSIAKETLKNAGGDLNLISNENETIFEGHVLRVVKPAQGEEKQEQ